MTVENDISRMINARSRLEGLFDKVMSDGEFIGLHKKEVGKYYKHDNVQFLDGRYQLADDFCGELVFISKGPLEYDLPDGYRLNPFIGEKDALTKSFSFNTPEETIGLIHTFQRGDIHITVFNMLLEGMTSDYYSTVIFTDDTLFDNTERSENYAFIPRVFMLADEEYVGIPEAFVGNPSSNVVIPSGLIDRFDIDSFEQFVLHAFIASNSKQKEWILGPKAILGATIGIDPKYLIDPVDSIFNDFILLIEGQVSTSGNRLQGLAILKDKFGIALAMLEGMAMKMSLIETEDHPVKGEVIKVNHWGLHVLDMMAIGREFNNS